MFTGQGRIEINLFCNTPQRVTTLHFVLADVGPIGAATHHHSPGLNRRGPSRVIEWQRLNELVGGFGHRNIGGFFDHGPTIFGRHRYRIIADIRPERLDLRLRRWHRFHGFNKRRVLGNLGRRLYDRFWRRLGRHFCNLGFGLQCGLRYKRLHDGFARLGHHQFRGRRLWRLNLRRLARYQIRWVYESGELPNQATPGPFNLQQEV